MSQSVDPFSIVRQIKTRGPAPVHLWDPPFCGDSDMRIARDGTWFHQGSPIRRQALVQLFSSILKFEAGEFFLVTPVEKVSIEVEDCPFLAVSVDAFGSETLDRPVLQFTTNTDEVVIAGEENLITVGSNTLTEEPHPVVHVRNGLNALISRNVFYQLVAMAVQREITDEQGNKINASGVYSGDNFFVLGAL